MNKSLNIVLLILLNFIIVAVIRITFKIEADSNIAFTLNSLSIGVMVGLLLYLFRNKWGLEGENNTDINRLNMCEKFLQKQPLRIALSKVLMANTLNQVSK